ncbi:hypothetical protein ACLOJK_024738 [Asimina triloba]
MGCAIRGAAAALSPLLQGVCHRLHLLDGFKLFRGLHKELEKSENRACRCGVHATEKQGSEELAAKGNSSNRVMFYSRMAHRIKEIRERLDMIGKRQLEFSFWRVEPFFKTTVEEEAKCFEDESDRALGLVQDANSDLIVLGSKEIVRKHRRQENPNLIALGKEIVKKYGASPLAAKALGSLMCFKREEKESQYIKENEVRNLAEEKNCIFAALGLSYHHM